MKKWFKSNKGLLSIILTVGLTSYGVPAYLAKPAADAVTSGIEQYAESAE